MKRPAQADEVGPDLVRKASAGDPDALRSLIEGAYPMVRRWALVHTGNPADAEDLTQDVLVHVIQRLDTFAGTSRFSTWLYTVTRNAATDRLRRQARRSRKMNDPRSHVSMAPDEAEDPAATADRSHIRAVIEVFFEELPGRQREVFELAELQGLPSPEIAEMLGIEAVSVRAHLFKARRLLRQRILESHPELAEEWS